eukprot:9460708-Pyramimonas_sp.AAC.1
MRSSQLRADLPCGSSVPRGLRIDVRAMCRAWRRARDGHSPARRIRLESSLGLARPRAAA